MLTIHQALAPNQKDSPAKTGLAIAGGGPVGAIYELGALRALDESIDGLRLHELDVYVGVSSGALIAAGLANRMTTAELCRIFMGKEHASLRFDPGDFLRPAYKEYFQRAVRLPTILADTLVNMVRHAPNTSVSQLIRKLGQAVPSGIFDNETIHDFLEEAFEITAPRSIGHNAEFIAAAKGETAFDAPLSHFGYAGPMTATILLGNLASRFEGKLAFDPAMRKFVDNDKANALMTRRPRSGWYPQT